MSTNTESKVTVQEVINHLRAPIHDVHDLVRLLCIPLEATGLLPLQYRKYHTLSSESSKAIDASKTFPILQRILLETILPTWEPTLKEEGYMPLIQQYFCPDDPSNSSTAAGIAALCAYSSILSLSTQIKLDMLLKLTREYPIDRLYKIISEIPDAERRSLAWDDCLRNVFAVPGKVANALEGRIIPPLLEMPDYTDNLSVRCEYLLYTLSSTFVPGDVSLLTQLFTKLVGVGMFPSSTHLSPSQPSFFRSTLLVIRQRLRENGSSSQAYKSLWSTLMSSLPSLLTQQAVVGSLFASLESMSVPDACNGSTISREALLLQGVLGEASSDTNFWQVITAVILTRTWSQNHARLFVCWISRNTRALESFISGVLSVWTSPDHIKYSLLSHHRYVSALLLLSVTQFPCLSPQVEAVALSPSFVSAIGTYIGHTDNSIRRCGMLVAEIVASRVGKSLDFCDWDGDDDGRNWAREMRKLCIWGDTVSDPRFEDRDDVGIHEGVSSNDNIEGDSAQNLQLESEVSLPRSSGMKTVEIPTDAGYDSDDSLTGYASPSAGSPSPTPSELLEIEQDPTLHIGVKKVSRPVYLAQLGALLRNTHGLGSGEESHEAEKIEMALTAGEDLIRRKRDFGTELVENAANLVYGFIVLNNNYDLEDFDDKRQRIVTALVACCPKVAAPCAIEEFFKSQYSTEQRFVILNALAMGARELASLPTYSSSRPPLFPSKKLPPGLHQKYSAAGLHDHVGLLLGDITREAADKSREPVTDSLPEFNRERQLRIRKAGKVTEVVQRPIHGIVPPQLQPPKAVTYPDVAAEYFIMPFINRFWVFLRDEQVREERTAHRDILFQYRGAGTGLILNPVILSHFLRTMAVLVHASRNGPQWLAVIAPEALELAVTLGSRQVSLALSDQVKEMSAAPGGRKDEAAVLTSSLDLAIIVLDGSLEQDGGRTLSLEHAVLLLSVGEWAGEVFKVLDSGGRVEGMGGTYEADLRRAAAGVVLKFQELASRWRRSMVDVR
ncbi:telomere length regulation protein-domain-containing protein [Pisolithus croceorrhizus]|nr:telomere length regulation protein-domain-containing protein [Pisolithus croceorrhizus]